MAFVFKITTTASPQTFTIPCQNVGTFNATIDWGDGSPTSSITAYNDADLAHSYTTAGQYTVTITGAFPNIYFDDGGDKLLVDEVVDLGDVGWVSLGSAFRGCSNMTAFAGATANTSLVTNMSVMFRDCSSLTSLDLSGFDTSSVTDMSVMFSKCSSLTSLDLSGFDTSSVTNMSVMFIECSSITSLDLSGFDTSLVTSISAMFFRCSSLTSLDVSGFNTSLVTNMSSMFRECSSLTSLDLSGFDTSSVTSMSLMFSKCSSLTSLDLSGFDTSSVTNMGFMFFECFGLTGLKISGWDVSSVTNGGDFLNGANSALSQEEYDATLIAWSQQPVQSGVTWHFGDAQYSNTPIAVSIQMEGLMTGDSKTLVDWTLDASNNILLTTGASDFTFTQEAGGVVDSVTGGSFTSGINVPFNIASRHGSTFINGAVDGTVLTANLTPTALPDLSATDLQLATVGGPMIIKRFRVWADNITDAGIGEAST